MNNTANDNAKPADPLMPHLAAMGVDPETARTSVLAVGLWWPYYIRLLDESHIPAMIALQNAAGDGQVVNRTAATMRDHFAAGHIAFGVFHDGRLVAQSLIRTEPAAPQGLPLAPSLRDRFMKQSIMGGVVVAREARGKGLMDAMVRLWIHHAEKQGADIAHARVRPGNDKSWQVFLRNGLSITAQGPSPDEPDHDVYFMYRPLQSAFALAQDGVGRACHGRGGDIAAQLDRGFVATGWNAQRRQFVFARPAAS